MTIPGKYSARMFLLLAVTVYARAASQLAPVYETLAKDPRVVIQVDLFKVVPAEEIPVLARVLGSGNWDLMIRAAGVAREILQIHIKDARPGFQQLKPPLPEVKQEFESLVPVLTAHFGDSQRSSGGYNGVVDDEEILWKTRVVQFMDVLGAPPPPEMLTWMLRVVQWPKDGGRAEAGMLLVDAQRKAVEAAGGPKYLRSDHEAGLETTRREELGVALEIIPVLSRLDPMPPVVMNALLQRMDDSSEPYGAASTIFWLSQNKGINRSELADRLVTKALDVRLPVDLRAAAIHGIGLLDVTSAKLKLKGLDRDPDEKIAGAAIDAGVNLLEVMENRK